ncbi:uncharacterized protein LOC142930364 [Petromyzon marinus]|uniref:uncharacterized protein LOC142930364 n=1 Tax=Petromyzon marinus TaxID=7757 RepID=UPI003F705E0B
MAGLLPVRAWCLCLVVAVTLAMPTGPPATLPTSWAAPGPSQGEVVTDGSGSPGNLPLLPTASTLGEPTVGGAAVPPEEKTSLPAVAVAQAGRALESALSSRGTGEDNATPETQEPPATSAAAAAFLTAAGAPASPAVAPVAAVAPAAAPAIGPTTAAPADAANGSSAAIAAAAAASGEEKPRNLKRSGTELVTATQPSLTTASSSAAASSVAAVALSPTSSSSPPPATASSMTSAPPNSTLSTISATTPTSSSSSSSSSSSLPPSTMSSTLLPSVPSSPPPSAPSLSPTSAPTRSSFSPSISSSPTSTSPSSSLSSTANSTASSPPPSSAASQSPTQPSSTTPSSSSTSPPPPPPSSPPLSPPPPTTTSTPPTLNSTTTRPQSQTTANGTDIAAPPLGLWQGGSLYFLISGIVALAALAVGVAAFAVYRCHRRQGRGRGSYRPASSPMPSNYYASVRSTFAPAGTARRLNAAKAASKAARFNSWAGPAPLASAYDRDDADGPRETAALLDVDANPDGPDGGGGGGGDPRAAPTGTPSEATSPGSCGGLVTFRRASAAGLAAAASVPRLDLSPGPHDPAGAQLAGEWHLIRLHSAHGPRRAVATAALTAEGDGGDPTDRRKAADGKEEEVVVMVNGVGSVRGGLGGERGSSLTLTTEL